jgi:hypothetical protein
MGIDPVSIGLMGLSALSAVAGSAAQKQQSKYQAQVAQNNAAIANMNATYAERAGAAKEQSEAYKIRGLLGQQTAGQAASGLDVNSGSAVDVRRGTAGLGNLSFANIRDNTAREAAGYRGQATNFANDAALAKASRRRRSRPSWARPRLPAAPMPGRHRPRSPIPPPVNNSHVIVASQVLRDAVRRLHN